MEKLENNKLRDFAKTVKSCFLAIIFSKLLAGCLQLILTFKLGPELFGQYSLLIVTLSWLNIFTFGFNGVLNRYLPSHVSNNLSNSYTEIVGNLSFGLTLGCCIACVATIFLNPTQSLPLKINQKYLQCLVIVYIIGTYFINFAKSLLKAHDKFKEIVIFESSYNVILLCVSLICFLLAGFDGLICIVFCSKFCGAIYLFCKVKGYFGKVRFQCGRIQNYFRQGLSIYIINFLGGSFISLLVMLADTTIDPVKIGIFLYLSGMINSKKNQLIPVFIQSLYRDSVSVSGKVRNSQIISIRKLFSLKLYLLLTSSIVWSFIISIGFIFTTGIFLREYATSPQFFLIANVCSYMNICVLILVNYYKISLNIGKFLTTFLLSTVIPFYFIKTIGGGFDEINLCVCLLITLTLFINLTLLNLFRQVNSNLQNMFRIVIMFNSPLLCLVLMRFPTGPNEIVVIHESYKYVITISMELILFQLTYFFIILFAAPKKVRVIVQKIVIARVKVILNTFRLYC